MYKDTNLLHVKYISYLHRRSIHMPHQVGHNLQLNKTNKAKNNLIGNKLKSRKDVMLNYYFLDSTISKAIMLIA